MNASQLSFLTLASDAETSAAKGKLAKYVLQSPEEKCSEAQEEQISEYLLMCRSNTVHDTSDLDNILTNIHPSLSSNNSNSSNSYNTSNNSTHANDEQSKYWICDMPDNEAYFMIITPSGSYVINYKLEVYKFTSNYFSYFCVANRDPNSRFNLEISIIEGSFVMTKEKIAGNKDRAMFIIEDCIVYKGELYNKIKWHKRTEKIKNIIARYRDVMRKDIRKGLDRYKFGFDSKDHFDNKNLQLLTNFWKGFVYDDKRHGRYVYNHRKGCNFTLGYIIRSDNHFPFAHSGKGCKSIVCWRYPPSFWCQIRLPLRVSFHASNMQKENPNIDFYLRSPSYQLFRALTATLTPQSLEKLRSMETLLCSQNMHHGGGHNMHNRNGHNGGFGDVKVLVEMTYEKQGYSGYKILRHLPQTDCNVLVTSNEAKYRNDARKYFQHNAGLHSLREGDYRLLLTSTVEEAVKANNEMVSHVNYKDVQYAFEYSVRNQSEQAQNRSNSRSGSNGEYGRYSMDSSDSTHGSQQRGGNQNQNHTNNSSNGSNNNNMYEGGMDRSHSRDY